MFVLATFHHVAVVGAGSWGTALAVLIASNGYSVRLWARDVAQVKAMAHLRCNQRYLPEVKFPANLTVTTRLNEAVIDASLTLLAVPSHTFNETVTAVTRACKDVDALLWVTKGFEPQTGRLLHQVVREHCLAVTRMGVLSGPSFAHEVANRIPTAVALGGSDIDFAEDAAAVFRNNHFRVYTNDDLIGVQIGGAVKNVLAVAAGVIDGLGLGANSRAALITRGLREMKLLGMALGAQPDTLSGLSGIGDLILTCTDDQSRNRQFGLALGRGAAAFDVPTPTGQVIESKYSCREVMRIATERHLTLPICEQVYRLIVEGITPGEAMEALMERTPGQE